MPEGHSIHRLARDMQELAGKQLFATSPQGRVDASQLSGSTCTAVDAYGKHLFVDFENELSAHVHLGMRGKFLRFSPITGDAMKQVRLRLATNDVAWDLVAPSACDVFTTEQRMATIAKLGPDPLRSDADVEVALTNIRRHRGTIGAALMDQSVIAGVGNVFRAEALHECRIDPLRAAKDIDDAELDMLWHSLQKMMKQAVDDGRIITVDVTDRLSLPEEESRHVYKQERCYDCGTDVVTADIDGRTSYACPTCQPV